MLNVLDNTEVNLMKRLVIAVVLGFSLFSVTTTNLAQADVQNDSNKIETIVVSIGDDDSNNDARVYQYVNGTMRVTNRTMKTTTKTRITHWYAQKVKLDGKTWWKVGENQYFKPDRVSVVDTAQMEQHGLTVENYLNYNTKNGVSMINEN